MFTNAGGPSARLILLMGFAYANALIGFLDDYVKFFKKQNEGLSAKQKYMLQLIVAAAYLGISRAMGLLETALYIPFLDLTWELGVFYYIIAILLITGIVNSVNLTDGLDGLASSVTLVVGIFMAIASHLYDVWEVGFVSAVTIGACAGFLVYNFYPARVFMGDTGSLFLGGMVVGGAFLMQNPLLVLVFGIVYVVETASVILQVGYFKLTHGKRLFKMAPIHHHFEKCGWKEEKIVITFAAVSALMCALAWFGL
jgi:phospho-N-acetylmuramoyl-pentapeptide-transferase